MSEPGRFSLEKLVTTLPLGRPTFLAAVLALLAALTLSRETITRIPELVEASYSYDAQLRETVRSRSVTTDGLAMTFVDVDDAALKAWGNATHTTSRAKLTELVDHVVKQKPALIFVDFDLNGTSPDEGDKTFYDLLKGYKADAPPLLLTRELEPLDCPGGQCKDDPCKPHEEGAGAVEGSPFLVDETKKPNIYWVSTVFAPDDDGVVRSWRLWDFACNGAAPSVVPSPQLVAAALANRDVGKAGLAEYLNTLKGKTSGDVPAKAVAWPRNKDARKALLPFLIGGTSQTHVTDWLGASAEFRYQRVRALSVVEDQIADSAIRGRAVVIGASYGPDKLKTPFGVMPGAALIANAIAVAPAILDHPPSSRVAVMALTLLLAAAYGTIAKTLRAIPAAVVIVIFSYGWLSLATYWLNPADAVETVSSALVILGAFLTIEAVIEIAMGVIEGKGLGALLRKSKSTTKAGAQAE
jgi:CHASE2 domain-containing sensor protein